MKILILINSGYETGGAERKVVIQKKYLEKKGHIVKIFSSNLRSDLPHFSDYEFKAISPNHPLRLLSRSFNPYAYFKLREILKDFNPDIVNLNTMSEFSPSILFLLKKVPAFITIHGSEDFTKSLLIWRLKSTDFKKYEYSIKNLNFIGRIHYLYYAYIQRTIYKIGFQNIDLAVSVSKFIKHETIKDISNNIAIYNGIELLSFTKITDLNNLVYVGRLEKIKGIDYVIDALPAILEKFSDVNLTIVGDGTYKRILVDKVKKLHLEKHIKFVGHIKHADIEQFYRKSTLLLMPSIVPEAFGLVGVEAMSAGRPVIASRVGGIPEWLADGKTGYLVEPGNSSQIAEKVIFLLSNKKLLEQMGRNARSRSQEFTIEKYVKNIEKVLLDLFKKYKSPRV